MEFKSRYAKKVPKLRDRYIKLKKYLKYPGNIVTDLKMHRRLPQAKLKNICFHAPNYIYLDVLNKNSIMIDVGCGYLADFSLHLINKYNLQSVGIDPTLKHQKFLEEIAANTNNKFKYIRAVISNQTGKITFYENPDYESGSIISQHKNIESKAISSYNVDSYTLSQIPILIGVDNIDLLKLDIEGAEYSLLDGCTEKDLQPFNQLFIEFHHNSVKYFSRSDTNRIIKKLDSMGFQHFSLDDLNYLFYR